MKNSKKEMDQRQYNIFMAYWGMGADRSLEKLYYNWSENGLKDKKPNSLTTLKNWSTKFNWQDRIQDLDNKANQDLLDDAIGAAKQTRIDIMKLFRAVALKFAKQIKDNQLTEMTSADVERFWKMSRVEMGLPTDNTKTEHEMGDKLTDAVLNLDIINKLNLSQKDFDESNITKTTKRISEYLIKGKFTDDSGNIKGS